MKNKRENRAFCGVPCRAFRQQSWDAALLRADGCRIESYCKVRWDDSDVAREAADIILLKSEIEAVPEALGLARATLRTIRQNLFWAFFYNAISVPLAALGFLSPVLCALAMGLSDLLVIGNALRMSRWRSSN